MVVCAEFLLDSMQCIGHSVGPLPERVRTANGPGETGDKVSCSHCGKLLKNKRVLEYHIKSLHGNKTFFCKHCKEEFQDKANLKEHLKSHKKYVLNKKSHLRNVTFVAKLQRTFQTSLGSISI